ncbi:MAG TPA: hypothetical protein PKV67_09585 [Hyphomonas sp.]|nr:hypothetical protein [Hyphomonas sp.]HRJ01018.1 hypothetical protein [Hyphomonas sp.]HRK68983.1 hypothetical protein [Hyphomonas sp.]
MAFALPLPQAYLADIMTVRISALNLAKEGWRHGLGALVPNLRWLGLFALAGGFYSAALHLEGNLAAPFAMIVATFLAGVQFSRGVYRSLIGPRKGGFLNLAHANLAVYFVYLILLVVIVPLLNIMLGILIRAKGTFDLGKDSSADLVQQATLDLIPTSYGLVFILLNLAAFAILAWLALRLCLIGAATIDRGETHVFRAYSWTNGHVLKLGAAALATHASPFAAAVAANMALRAVVPDTAIGHVIEGAGGILLFAPFILAGHGMAAAAYRRLRPEAAAPQ